MASENLELARRGVDVFNSGDLDEIAELWTDDITIDFSGSRSPYAGVYSGKEEGRRFMEEARETWDELRWEPRELVEVGRNEVLIDNVMHARGRGSGVDVEGRGAQLWTVRDGLLAHLRLFQSREEADEWLAQRGASRVDNRDVAADSITLTRRAVEVFNAGGADIDAAGDPPPGIYVDEPELVPLRGALEGTVYTGPSSWRDFWDASRESWAELRLEIDRMEQVGPGVLAVGTLRGTSRETGAPVEARVAFAAHVRDGLIARNAVHLDEAGARAELESD